jgi:hypothetical protein
MESLGATKRRKGRQKMKKLTFMIIGVVLSLVLYSNPASAQRHGGRYSGHGRHSGGYYLGGHSGRYYYGSGSRYYSGWYGGLRYRHYPRSYWWGPRNYAYSGWWWSYPYAYPYAYLYPYSYYDPYPYPDSYSYSYPSVMSAPEVTVEPPAYSQQQEQPYYWYYCQNPQGYYPYVKSCPGGWRQVEPNPTPPNP